jgi:hypothetical protein
VGLVAFKDLILLLKKVHFIVEVEPRIKATDMTHYQRLFLLRINLCFGKRYAISKADVVLLKEERRNYHKLEAVAAAEQLQLELIVGI